MCREGAESGEASQKGWGARFKFRELLFSTQGHRITPEGSLNTKEPPWGTEGLKDSGLYYYVASAPHRHRGKP